MAVNLDGEACVNNHHIHAPVERMHHVVVAVIHDHVSAAGVLTEHFFLAHIALGLWTTLRRVVASAVHGA